MLSRSTAQRVFKSFSVAVILKRSHSLRRRLIINVTLFSDFNQSLDFLAFFRDSDVNVGGNL
jgi:hypothetical protein